MRRVLVDEEQRLALLHDPVGQKGDADHPVRRVRKAQLLCARRRIRRGGNGLRLLRLHGPSLRHIGLLRQTEGKRARRGRIRGSLADGPRGGGLRRAQLRKRGQHGPRSRAFRLLLRPCGVGGSGRVQQRAVARRRDGARHALLVHKAHLELCPGARSRPPRRRQCAAPARQTGSVPSSAAYHRRAAAPPKAHRSGCSGR